MSVASTWDAAALIGIAAAGVLYALGSRRLAQRGARVRRIERGAFWSGWAAVAVAVAPPLDRAAELSLSSHMIQHELLMLVGAPLMIVGRPLVPWLWAMPDRIRRWTGAELSTRAVGGAWQMATAPAIAWAVHGFAIWIWHLPVLYQLAVRNEALHAFQHASFVGTAILFWWGLVYGRYGRAAYGASVLYVFVTMVHTGVLGAIFALSTSPFYAVYRDRAAAAGVDATTDQQLAGLYMWIPAGLVLMTCGLALLVAWMAESERRDASGSRPAAPSPKITARHVALLLPLLLAANAGCEAIPNAAEARAVTGGDPYRGRDQIRRYGCDSCHTIPGVRTAHADVGPPLTRVARRVYLAGHLANTPENMRRWIEHPRAIDARTAMPEMGVTSSDSRDIVAYLYTLR